MATTAKKVREKQRQKIVAKYAEKRKALKEAGDYLGLAALPRDASPTRLHNRCEETGRPRGYYRYFGLSRIVIREKAHKGELPGLKKASW